MRLNKTDEAADTRDLIQRLQWLGWRCDWHPDSRRLVGNPGKPDITCVRSGRLVFIEVKKPEGVVSERQKDWIDAISGCGIEVHVFVLPLQLELALKVMA